MLDVLRETRVGVRGGGPVAAADDGGVPNRREARAEVREMRLVDPRVEGLAEVEHSEQQDHQERQNERELHKGRSFLLSHSSVHVASACVTGSTPTTCSY